MDLKNRLIQFSYLTIYVPFIVCIDLDNALVAIMRQPNAETEHSGFRSPPTRASKLQCLSMIYDRTMMVLTAQ